MKIPTFLYKIFLFFGLIKEPISMEDLYQIIGHTNEGYFYIGFSNIGNHPYIPEEFYSNPGREAIPDEDAYVRSIKEKIRKKRLEKHIIISKNSPFLITETGSYYYTKYKITIKNLVINTRASTSPRKMIFDPMSQSSDSDSVFDSSQKGVHLVFENNLFVGNNRYAMADFHPKEKAYLVFKNNKFESGGLSIETKNSFKIELTGNKFIDSHIDIICKSGSISPNDVYQPNVVCIENNAFYSNDEIPSKLIFNGEQNTKCYFKGKNTIDNLMISTTGYLHWGGYQNIDPQGKHAHPHKKMLMELMENVIDKNDKMQETRFRRELLKCERALIKEEETVRSLQDKFILWWSFWISDYGISWLRPLFWLTLINLSLTLFIIIVNFFNPECLPKFSPDKWWFLFSELFSPLSNLSNLTTKDSGWISFFNIAQKAFLAAAYYEVIKIFRRFSK